ncbi:cobalamin-independent methionine synthase II family protein [Companilactobacillus sp.]|uniref:cobalamin-independent methionine synthase II family protein n=1 Tax=Companilactobacillus sp. TaxID=2767905 RepID=UPI0025C2C1DD|nr:cobalamin-independent methionine synthase II family protein [Companilactobacillus sp.]MCH4009447.1 cobalamin-independent methionine synthase II family protein [Companilactobacillus sp.]MCH4050374.1 cobalamin-independent methionine synthase II family protein [Companilactobacillus sp.]MCH4077389.1 cobalamin-independent methionine synthase II family protein [Companilactobacillus sp.]MCH4125965.1 cobalamin-independent methionine synthase II family protein [Companilactobacillus sp.]MCI1311674.1 
MTKSYPLFPTTLIGSWPRSREVLLALRKHRNGQMSDDDFNELIENETARIIKLQEKLGLDFIVSGELSRDNYCSFVADRIGGVDLLSMNDVIDYVPDKQSFEDILSTLDVPSIAIRNAICTGKLEYHPIAVNELKMLKKYTDKPVKITLPGPYLLTRSMWLSKLSGKAYDSKEDLGKDVVKILQQEIDNLQKIGVDIIQFDEPVLTEVVFTEGKTRSFMCAALAEKKDPTDELEFAKSLLKPVMDHIDRNKSIASMHVCRGNWSNDESILLTGAYTPLLDLFEYVDPDLLTLEYSTPRAGDFSTLMASDQIRNNDIIGLGVENPRLYDAESVDFIKDKVKDALQYLPADRIFINPDCGFATFSNRPVNKEEFITNKINSLVEASHQLRQEYSTVQE